jgi:hypothetical protein
MHFDIKNKRGEYWCVVVVVVVNDKQGWHLLCNDNTKRIVCFDLWNWFFQVMGFVHTKWTTVQSHFFFFLFLSFCLSCWVVLLFVLVHLLVKTTNINHRVVLIRIPNSWSLEEHLESWSVVISFVVQCFVFLFQ